MVDRNSCLVCSPLRWKQFACLFLALWSLFPHIAIIAEISSSFTFFCSVEERGILQVWTSGCVVASGKGYMAKHPVRHGGLAPSCEPPL